MLFFVQEWEEKRRQNIEKMNEEMERIAEYERGQRVRESLFVFFIAFVLLWICHLNQQSLPSIYQTHVC